jgi:gluconolactonase
MAAVDRGKAALRRHSADPRPGNPDGMKIDEQGNIYSAGPGGVWIFSPEGKPLATMLIPEKVSPI